jgi:lipopolysaccharide/colanic/teichoic acid biosynthesis glycosyltransferase
MRQLIFQIGLAKGAILFLDVAAYWSVVLFSGLRLALLPQYVLLFVILILSLYAFGAYDMCRNMGLHSRILSSSAGILVGAVASLPLLFLFPENIHRPQFFAIVGMGFILTGLSRTFVVRALQGLLPERHVVVIGRKDEWSPLFEEISTRMGGKLSVTSYLNPTPVTLDATLGDCSGNCGVLVADPKLYAIPNVQAHGEFLQRTGVEVAFLPKLAEETLKRIPMQCLRHHGNYYTTALGNISPDPAQRVFDLVCSGIGLFIALPLMIVIAAAVRLEDGGPALFRQRRIGLNGRPFTMHKFRSMSVHASGTEGQFEQEAQFVTRTGRITRKLRLDELPQLWDVFRGVMSLIGPRPEMESFHVQCMDTIPFYRYRTRLRPGITGWAQVRYKHTITHEDYVHKTEYDLFYVKNRTALLDLQIILRTVETMLGMKGAR